MEVKVRRMKKHEPQGGEKQQRGCDHQGVQGTKASADCPGERIRTRESVRRVCSGGHFRYAPLPCRTTETVLYRIWKSRHRVHFSMYSRSSAKLRSKDGSPRAVTCHKP